VWRFAWLTYRCTSNEISGELLNSILPRAVSCVSLTFFRSGERYNSSVLAKFLARLLANGLSMAPLLVQLACLNQFSSIEARCRGLVSVGLVPSLEAPVIWIIVGYCFRAIERYFPRRSTDRMRVRQRGRFQLLLVPSSGAEGSESLRTL
jgi:hypothetical protein